MLHNSEADTAPQCLDEVFHCRTLGTLLYYHKFKPSAPHLNLMASPHAKPNPIDISNLNPNHDPKANHVTKANPKPRSLYTNLTDSGNYSSIALGSLLGKVFDLLLLDRYSDCLVTSQLQFGFKTLVTRESE